MWILPLDLAWIGYPCLFCSWIKKHLIIVRFWTPCTGRFLLHDEIEDPSKATENNAFYIKPNFAPMFQLLKGRATYNLPMYPHKAQPSSPSWPLESLGFGLGHASPSSSFRAYPIIALVQSNPSGNIMCCFWASPKQVLPRFPTLTCSCSYPPYQQLTGTAIPCPPPCSRVSILHPPKVFMWRVSERKLAAATEPQLRRTSAWVSSGCYTKSYHQRHRGFRQNRDANGTRGKDPLWDSSDDGLVCVYVPGLRERISAFAVQGRWRGTRVGAANNAMWWRMRRRKYFIMDFCFSFRIEAAGVLRHWRRIFSRCFPSQSTGLSLAPVRYSVFFLSFFFFH